MLKLQRENNLHISMNRFFFFLIQDKPLYTLAAHGLDLLSFWDWSTCSMNLGHSAWQRGLRGLCFPLRWHFHASQHTAVSHWVRGRWAELISRLSVLLLMNSPSRWLVIFEDSKKTTMMNRPSLARNNPQCEKYDSLFCFFPRVNVSMSYTFF